MMSTDKGAYYDACKHVVDMTMNVARDRMKHIIDNPEKYDFKNGQDLIAFLFSEHQEFANKFGAAMEKIGPGYGGKNESGS